MPNRYYCDYCDTFLTHDSPSVRKTHCAGRKHKENVKFYYQKWMEDQAQSLIDATTAAFKATQAKTGLIPPPGLPVMQSMPPITSGMPTQLPQPFPPPVLPGSASLARLPFPPPMHPMTAGLQGSSGILPLPPQGFIRPPGQS